MRYWNALNCIKLELLDNNEETHLICLYLLSRSCMLWQSDVTCFPKCREIQNWFLDHKDHRRVMYHRLTITHEDHRRALSLGAEHLSGKPHRPSTRVHVTGVGVFFLSLTICHSWPPASFKDDTLNTGCKYVLWTFLLYSSFLQVCYSRRFCSWG